MRRMGPEVRAGPRHFSRMYDVFSKLYKPHSVNECTCQYPLDRQSSAPTCPSSSAQLFPSVVFFFFREAASEGTAATDQYGSTPLQTSIVNKNK